MNIKKECNNCSAILRMRPHEIRTTHNCVGEGFLCGIPIPLSKNSARSHFCTYFHQHHRWKASVINSNQIGLLFSDELHKLSIRLDRELYSVPRIDNTKVFLIYFKPNYYLNNSRKDRRYCILLTSQDRARFNRNCLHNLIQLKPYTPLF